MNGLTSNNKAVLLYCIFHNHNHIGVATRRAGGCNPCKRLRYSNRAVGNKAPRIIVKQVVYDEFIKQIRTVKHSFNTTGTENYTVQLAVPPSIKNNYNNHNQNNTVLKKVNKQVHLKIRTRVGTIVD